MGVGAAHLSRIHLKVAEGAVTGRAYLRIPTWPVSESKMWSHQKASALTGRKIPCFGGYKRLKVLNSKELPRKAEFI